MTSTGYTATIVASRWRPDVVDLLDFLKVFGADPAQFIRLVQMRLAESMVAANKRG